MLAHVASAMGIICAENIAGVETTTLNYEMLPKAVYCQPQVASFGLTEEKAKERGYDVKIGRFPFQANGKALGLVLMVQGLGGVVGGLLLGVTGGPTRRIETMRQPRCLSRPAYPAAFAGRWEPPGSGRGPMACSPQKPDAGPAREAPGLGRRNLRKRLGNHAPLPARSDGNPGVFHIAAF